MKEENIVNLKKWYYLLPPSLYQSKLTWKNVAAFEMHNDSLVCADGWAYFWFPFYSSHFILHLLTRDFVEIEPDFFFGNIEVKSKPDFNFHGASSTQLYLYTCKFRNL